MIIHVVQQGETINSIANMYGKDIDRLIQENGLENADNLAIGQSIVIVYAKQTHTVKEEDTLQGIADQYGITLIQLLRNNPYLLDRENIFPGETLVIHYEDEKISQTTTNGLVFPYIDLKILEKNLLFLTYLSVYSYSVAANGDLDDIDDIDIINSARSYGVAPIMVISNLKESGYDNEVAHNIIVNQDIRNNFIQNVLSVAKKKNYYGIDINFPYIQSEDLMPYIEFITDITDSLHKEGFKVFITMTPNTFVPDSEISREESNYSKLGQTLDGIILFYYDFAYPTDISTEMIPFYYIRNLIELISLFIPPEKIIISAITIGYIWEIPYIEDVSKVYIISSTNAAVLASESNSVIQFNKLNLSSYFYIQNHDLRQVIFYDARGLSTYSHLVPDFGLHGMAFWTVMYYIPQTFFFMNTQYDIVNIEI